MSAAADKGGNEPTERDRLAIYRPDLNRVLSAADAPHYRYAQVYEHLMRRPEAPLSKASNLPLSLRSALEEEGSSSLALERRREDADGTTKVLLTAHDDAQIEAVVMRYERRVTVCLSTQVGCSLGCTFCSTGAMGFERNLSVAEIVDQVRILGPLLKEEGREITNVVFMGMGEPLLNLDACLPPSVCLRTLRDSVSPNGRSRYPPSASPPGSGASPVKSRRSTWRSPCTPPTTSCVRD